MWDMLLEGNLDSVSVLRSPSFLSPYVGFFQRPLPLPLHSQCPACLLPSSRWQSSRKELQPRVRSRPSCSGPWRTKLPRWRWSGWAPRSVSSLFMQQAGAKRGLGDPRSMGQGPREEFLFFITSLLDPADGAEPCPGGLAPGAAAGGCG